MVVDCSGPPEVIVCMTPKVSKKAYTIFTTNKKNVMGESKGITIVPNLFQKLAPSIAAASIIDFGMACRPAKKK